MEQESVTKKKCELELEPERESRCQKEGTVAACLESEDVEGRQGRVFVVGKEGWVVRENSVWPEVRTSLDLEGIAGDSARGSTRDSNGMNVADS
ncbi:hypothetical protein L2E82_51950 [Cichorium intybus]|nr:hypothetical protein L2E82_51950 [Cichorium intybus]